MSKHNNYRNYNSYSSSNTTNTKPISQVDDSKEVDKEEVIEEVAEGVVSGNIEAVPSEEEPVEEEPVEEEPTMQITPVQTIGVVKNCSRLNVREAADADADVIGTVEEGSEVEIDEASSTSDFYKVYTAAGLEGFCMKKFISIKS